jgi:hypothetical protein
MDMVIYSIWPDIRLFSLQVSGFRPDIRQVESGIRPDIKKGRIVRQDLPIDDNNFWL